MGKVRNFALVIVQQKDTHLFLSFFFTLLWVEPES